MTDVRSALVIGGGVAGPVVAMALRKAGITATVYEGYGRTADGVGGQLMIAPNGMAALRVVGADDAVRAVGFPTPRIVIESASGRRWAEFRDPPDVPTSHSMARADLYRALYDEAVGRGIRIEHGKRLTGAEETGKGITAHFADGGRASADVLIGADGIRSAVRSLVDPAAPPPRYEGLFGVGCWTPDSGLPSTDGAYHMVFGRRAFFGYLVREDGTAGWWISIPRQEPMPLAEARAISAGEWLRQTAEMVAADNTPARQLVDRADPEALVLAGGMELLPPQPAWYRGRMVLAGDAVHAPSSSSGQGASLAIESAVELARCLRDQPTVADAFAAYERLRRPRVERVIADAERTNRRKAAGPLTRVLLDLTMPTVMRFAAKPEKTAWLYGHRIEWAAAADPEHPKPSRPGRTRSTAGSAPGDARHIGIPRDIQEN